MNFRKSLAVLLVLAASALPVSSAYAGELSVLDDLKNGTAVKDSLPAVNPPETPIPMRSQTGGNVTEEYNSIFRSVPQGVYLFANDSKLRLLSDYRILFVPGFMTDPSINPDLVYKSGSDGARPTYFEEQVHWLRDNYIGAGIVDIESEDGISPNARRIAAEIEKSKKPVIIVSHSKGGLDTLETLITRPDLRRKVRSIVFIQSPFYGAPIADYVLERPVLAETSSLALRLMGGSLQSVRDLSVKSRAAYMEKNAGEIAEITGSIPTLSFGSWKQDEKNTWDTNLEPFRNLMDGWGMNNDGLVPVQSAMLPGAGQIAIEGVDHLATVLEVRKPEFKRLDFSRTLFVMLITRWVD
jgi:pimeloyl-ACP methyl ester carboxylesterase